ncbi:MAG: peptidylprolyl isomerase [Lentilitoribacter sp.]
MAVLMALKTKKAIAACAMALVLTLGTGIYAPNEVQAASQIKIVVNKQAITSTDLKRRTALLRLQRQSGKLSTKAREQLIEEALIREELTNRRALPSQSEVDRAFATFASGNGMSAKRMGSLLNQAGVGSKHFKEFIRLQIGWPRMVSARYGSSGKLSTQELVSKMLERGDDNPTTTEYILQQVIFVVPSSKRSKSTINRRNTEAKRFRPNIDSCDTTKQKAVGLKDVTVRNLGRFLKPELPPEWSPLISKTEINKPTGTRVTDKGVEFLVICKSRSVSDDKAAEMVFRLEQEQSGEASANSKRYLDELRRRAVISNR